MAINVGYALVSCQLMTNYCTAYKCTHCEERFPNNTGLVQHESRKHKWVTLVAVGRQPIPDVISK